MHQTLALGSLPYTLKKTESSFSALVGLGCYSHEKTGMNPSKFRSGGFEQCLTAEP
jgi:hypothetical protein